MKFTKTTKQHGEQHQSQYVRGPYFKLLTLVFKPPTFTLFDWWKHRTFDTAKGRYGSVLHCAPSWAQLCICTARWATEHPPSYESLKAQ